MPARVQKNYVLLFKYGVLAGIAGGGAEIIWISVVAAFTSISATDVARGIDASIGIYSLSSQAAVLAGIAIHMSLAVFLGIAVTFGIFAFWKRPLQAIEVYTLVPATLAGIWVINFLVVLPQLNPELVQIVPYPISFLSKFLFGLATAEILRRMNRSPDRSNLQCQTN